MRIGQRKAARTGSPDIVGRRPEIGAVRSVDAHLASCLARISKAKSGAVPGARGLTGRKWPGKICRRAAVLPLRRAEPTAGSARLAERNQRLVAVERHGTFTRMVNAGPPSWEWRGPKVKTSSGEPEDARRHFGKTNVALSCLINAFAGLERTGQPLKRCLVGSPKRKSGGVSSAALIL
jgi:hypothetical protein